MTKTILDICISFEYFCLVLKRRTSDPRIKPFISDREIYMLKLAYEDGFKYSDDLKKSSTTIKDLEMLEP